MRQRQNLSSLLQGLTSGFQVGLALRGVPRRNTRAGLVKAIASNSNERITHRRRAAQDEEAGAVGRRGASKFSIAVRAEGAVAKRSSSGLKVI